MSDVPTVLVVDDDAAVRDFAREVLEGGGYWVLTAPGGEDALEAARSFDGAIEVLVTDVYMPGMNGAELVRRMADIRPRTRVLFMSGSPRRQVERSRLLPPGAPFLAKPFTPEVLLGVLEELRAPG